MDGESPDSGDGGNEGGNGNGTVIFNVNAETSGERTLKIYYSALEQCQLNIQVNETTLDLLMCPGNGGVATTGETPLEVTINLQAGDNSIVFGGVNGANAPNIDKIAIELTVAETKNLVADLIDNFPVEVTVK